MDSKLLDYYEEELQYLWETGQEFKQAFPKVARRLGIEDRECRDPYVERLLEGFAFLSARVRLKVDAEFPRFTHHLLETVYPNYLAPLPSMAVVQFEPDITQGDLTQGYPVERGTQLLSESSGATECDFRTAHDLTLWPVEIARAEYLGHAAILSEVRDRRLRDAKAELRIQLRVVTEGPTFGKLAIDRLPLYLSPGGELPMQLYERLVMNGVGVVVKTRHGEVYEYSVLAKSAIRPVGFDDEQALLPGSNRSFSGYRLLQEYFAFPERFLFFEITGLAQALRRCTAEEVQISLLLDHSDVHLEREVTAANFAMHCSPAINLFPKRADPIHLKARPEHQVVADITRPMDFEVYGVTRVLGYGTSAEREQKFLPLYSAFGGPHTDGHNAYYTIRRVPRLLSSRQSARELRHDYLGNEVFISLVDADEAPYASDLRQLSLRTLCTNRDLPLQMMGLRETSFRTTAGEPVSSVRCLAGPTKPRPSHVHGETAWRVINHLALNYLSITDLDENEGAAAMRELLRLYGDASEAHIKKQIEGIRSIHTRPITERMPVDGPMTFARGVEITLTLEEAAFAGTGAFLLGAVLEQFFARYVSINTFTKTVLKTVERRDQAREWPANLGKRAVL